MKHAGACKFCGQMYYVVGGDDMSDEQITHAATLQCGCEAAEFVQKVEHKKECAEANAKKLFENDGEIIINALLKLIPELAQRNIVKLSVTTAEGIKATLAGKEKSIRIERTEVNKAMLED